MTSPLVIGGVGGSGTRVVAEMSRAMGIYMGDDLNDASDNLWFRLLLTRPDWYFREKESNGQGIELALNVLEQTLQGRLQKSTEVDALLNEAATDVDRRELGRRWARKRVKTMYRSGSSGIQRDPWGWKEPNSHVYLRELHQHFGTQLRYIHVMRHGLDMAYSSNRRQALNWRRLYDMSADDPLTESTILEYWIRANTRAVEIGQSVLGDHFLVMNFDELCANPSRGVDRLVDYLGMDATPTLRTQLATMPIRPSSTGRWRAAGLSPFTEDQLQRTAALGFPV
jgi:hypothetical protein